MTELPTRSIDVAIVGAGPSGLVVADTLCALGVRCAVFEAGPLPLPLPDGPTALERLADRFDPGNSTRERYTTRGLPGAWQRVHAAGGRSLAWGGWCHRFSEQTLSDAALRGTPWPLAFAELVPHYRAVERRLHVCSGPLPDEQRHAARELGLRIRPKRMARVGARPWTALDLRRALPTVRPLSPVAQIGVGAGGAVAALVVGLDPANQVRVPARAVVLCASPVQTARLLLDPDIARRLPFGNLLGRGMTDHLVISWLALAAGPVAAPRPGSGSGFVPRFVNLGTTPDRDYVGGFCLEIHGPLPAAHLGAPRLAQLGLSSADAAEHHAFVVHALGDAAPHPDRHVSLHPQRRDAWGRPLPVLSLAWGPAELAMARDMQETGLALCDALLPRGGRVVPLGDGLASGGPTHETGGCAMGEVGTPADPWGRVCGVRGLYVGDAAAMPSAGDAHPTLTLLALARRTALTVAADLAKPGA